MRGTSAGGGDVCERPARKGGEEKEMSYCEVSNLIAIWYSCCVSKVFKKSDLLKNTRLFQTIPHDMDALVVTLASYITAIDCKDVTAQIDEIEERVIPKKYLKKMKHWKKTIRKEPRHIHRFKICPKINMPIKRAGAKVEIPLLCLCDGPSPECEDVNK